MSIRHVSGWVPRGSRSRGPPDPWRMAARSSPLSRTLTATASSWCSAHKIDFDRPASKACPRYRRWSGGRWPWLAVSLAGPVLRSSTHGSEPVALLGGFDKGRCIRRQQQTIGNEGGGGRPDLFSVSFAGAIALFEGRP